MKLPGIAPTTASIVIAEIADAKRFEDDKHVAGWVGLAPARYQSAGKDRKGHITKKGDTWLRKAMVQAAKAASQQSGSEFAEFYSRIAGRRGKGIAAVALARELLTEVWRIILTGKEYVERRVMKRTKYRLKRGVVESYDADKVAAILSSASVVTGGLG